MAYQSVCGCCRIASRAGILKFFKNQRALEFWQVREHYLLNTKLIILASSLDILERLCLRMRDHILEQGLEKFFCKGLSNKYFRLFVPYNLSLFLILFLHLIFLKSAFSEITIYYYLGVACLCSLLTPVSDKV